MDIYESFCRKSNAVLFATDLAARGLDFPEVNWVVQADCPEDAATYIHRVGRTARYQSGGQSLLLLLPSERNSMLQQLEDAKIPITDMKINTNTLQNPIRKLEAFLARDVQLKETAQRAFVSYAKSVYLMKDKSVFDIRSLDTDKYAHSLGLAVPPRIRFLQRMQKKEALNQSNQKLKFKESNSENEESEEEIEEEEEVNFENIKDNKQIKFDISDDEENGDDVLTMKRKDHDIENPLSESELVDFGRTNKNKKPMTKAAMVKKMIKKKIVPNKKITFDDEGESMYDSKSKQSEMARDYENEDEGGIDIARAKLVLREEDKFDKQRFREQVKAKHREEKRKLKESRMKDKQEEQDEFGDESESEGPDLSWLPDPDKVYGDKEDGDSETEMNFAPVEPKPNRANKRKTPKTEPAADTTPTPNKKKKKKSIGIDDLSVNETEELALMLLQGKTK